MNKKEAIANYGEAVWQKLLEQSRVWKRAHREEVNAYKKKYRGAHPDKVKADSQEQHRKGGKRYAKKLEYDHTGLQGEKNKIRKKHGKQYRPYKMIIAQDSQLHHEWIPDTSEYRGIALVEKVPHQYGTVDVIQILDGKITLLTEEEVKRGSKKCNNKRLTT